MNGFDDFDVNVSCEEVYDYDAAGYNGADTYDPVYDANYEMKQDDTVPFV